MIVQILQCVSSLTCSTLHCLTDVCLKVSDVCWRVSDSHGDRLHGVQHPAVDSWAEHQLPVGGSRDQRGHLGHRPVGLRLLGTYTCVMWSVCVTHVPRMSPKLHLCVVPLRLSQVPQWLPIFISGFTGSSSICPEQQNQRLLCLQISGELNSTHRLMVTHITTVLTVICWLNCSN